MIIFPRFNLAANIIFVWLNIVYSFVFFFINIYSIIFITLASIFFKISTIFFTIVIKLGPGVDPARRPGHGSTKKNFKNIKGFNILYEKIKKKKQSM